MTSPNDHVPCQIDVGTNVPFQLGVSHLTDIVEVDYHLHSLFTHVPIANLSENDDSTWALNWSFCTGMIIIFFTLINFFQVESMFAL